MARIAAAAVFVGGASLAVAGMAAAEEPDPCALNPLDAECLALVLPGGSESPSDAADTGNATQESRDNRNDNRNNGSGGEDSGQPSDGASPSAPGDTGNPGSTPPASTPPTDQQSVPPTSGAPTGTTPTDEETGVPTGAPTTGTECSIANGDVNCGTEKGSSAGSIGGSDPQRNYGVGAAAATDTPTATAAPGAAGTAGTTGGATDVPELADTGQSANLTFIVIGGVAMAGGGFAFTVLPRKLGRREATAAA